ncbi:DUF3152 domain-containing protein [Streptomyces sp. TRM66268-LWL]|uniref:DUF3152 domain-containing protein n=1 Tax=Streptomyces polyasparticus TaxID=2767826 RepID=A0ABR7S6L3_9ACTN|nr:DUF3152 domain-containing protein [Streptomyces polyasparticus]MBC9711121.1 DUF3152 domain-containing protein [Streptomyces polyasparticus]
MTPPRGVPQARPAMTPPHGVAQVRPGMTPPHGVPRVRPDGTPAHGTPRVPQQGAGRPHPEQREAGGGWGAISGTGPQPRISQTGPQPRIGQTGRQPRIPGPRNEYVSAFDGIDPLAEEPDLFDPAGRRSARDPYAAVTDFRHELSEDEAPPAAPVQPDPPQKNTKGRTFTGIAAAAVTTVLAVVVAGQVTDGRDQDPQGQAAEAKSGLRGDASEASRSDERQTPAAKPLSYAQKMAKKATLPPQRGSGEFEAVGGLDKAPGTGQKFRYRVDVEQGLGLDGALFAEAVQKTLNDERSWAHKGARTFERVSSGKVDFVITLASRTTTAKWCAKSGLDTTQDNVSCDSAATDRVMINADRWAQGAETYGDAIFAYRQMLINHEVGHRLGFNHVSCSEDGGLAPVMQQQTKFLDHDGITCRANQWVYPNS